MAELPKIVWHRLRRTSAGAAPSPDVASGEERTKSEHPDANLLTAFLEQSLTKRERALVMSHLAECAECREQISLVLPELEPESPLALRRAQRRRGWRLWQTARWGALAASLGALAVLVVLHHPEIGRHKLSLPVGEPTSVPAGANTQADNAGATPEALSAERSAPTYSAARKAEDWLAKEHGSLRASNENRNAKTKAAGQPKPSSLAIVREPGRAGPDALDSKASGARALLEKVPGAVVGPTPEASAAQGRESDSEFARDEIAASKKSALAANAESSEPAEMKSRTEIGAPVPRASVYADKDQARRLYPSSMAIRAVPPARTAEATRWTLSSSGKLERSLDNGRTWTEIEVDRNITLGALAAAGSDVWVGGSKGALYHSVDSGRHWDRVNLLLEGTTVTDDIIRIDFEDSRHGTVTTAAGASWVTVDGGRHWTKEVSIR